jgi:hypothetical protein
MTNQQATVAILFIYLQSPPDGASTYTCLVHLGIISILNILGNIGVCIFHVGHVNIDDDSSSTYPASHTRLCYKPGQVRNFWQQFHSRASFGAT